MLDNSMMEKESSHKKLSNEEYIASMKHELSHSFFYKLSNRNRKPFWLLEGVPIYTSGQAKLWGKPDILDSFLESYDNCPGRNRTMDKEFGYAVELLVESFGKHKLLELIRSLATVDTQEKFNASFAAIYGFEPTYDEFNKLHNSC